MDKDVIARLAQACFSSNPVIILGSGASMPIGLPSMSQLQKHLTDSIVTNGQAEEDAWVLVRTALGNGDHLEQALLGRILPPTLIEKIIKQTWTCVNNADQALFHRALLQTENFDVGRLLQALFVSANNAINVVTTNYDRAAEYACNSHGLLYSTGFTPGYLQLREGAEQLSFRRGARTERLVRIWKVHGSLDWFKRTDGETYSAPLFTMPTDGGQPLIVTPGFNNFEQTHNEPFRSTMAGADLALEQAPALLTIGFGFRDSHIEPKILARCRQASIPVAVIARTLTPEAKDFLLNKAGQKYIGLEKTDSGTRIYTSTSPDGEEIDDPNLWSLAGFMGLVS